MHAHLDEDWSELVVAAVRGRSRLVTCKSIFPLRILNPRSTTQCCHIVLSNFGGGLVQGDTIRLQISCEENSVLYVGSQANTRIFKNPDRSGPIQFVQGRLAEGALAVFNPDPLVPHQASSFKQIQEWSLENSSAFLLIDWLQSGRSLRGERFAYNAFTSEVRIRRENKTILLDTFESRPSDYSPSSMARFGPYETFLTIYFLGGRLDPVVDQLQGRYPNRERSAVKDLRDPRNDLISLPQRIVSINPCKNGGYIVRALGRQRSDLQPIVDQLLDLLSRADLLGFNPLIRKY